MRNFKLTLAYDGADFSGWQVQPGRSTVQGALAAALQKITGERVLPQGSGRTDAGVHALAQVASCALQTPMPASNLRDALNDILPPAIRMIAVEEAEADFHARHLARAKTYAYRIFRGDVCPPFLARYVWHYPYPLDVHAILAAAAQVEGEQDFTSFAAVDPDRAAREAEGEASNVRTVFSSRWMLASTGSPLEHVFAEQGSPAARAANHAGQELVYVVRGSGFLHHMVRNFVGLFLLIGKKRLAAGDVAGILQARDRSANPAATAPASGLFLVSVEY